MVVTPSPIVFAYRQICQCVAIINGIISYGCYPFGYNYFLDYRPFGIPRCPRCIPAVIIRHIAGAADCERTVVGKLPCKVVAIGATAAAGSYRSLHHCRNKEHGRKNER